MKGCHELIYGCQWANIGYENRPFARIPLIGRRLIPQWLNPKAQQTLYIAANLFRVRRAVFKRIDYAKRHNQFPYLTWHEDMRPRTQMTFHTLGEILGLTDIPNLLVLGCSSVCPTDCINTRGRTRNRLLSHINRTMWSPFNLEAINVARNIPRRIGECQT
jgi:hypothetical protein